MEKIIIKVTPCIRKKIFEVHKCTYPTIRTALDGRANTELAVRIRKTAIENGGKVYKGEITKNTHGHEKNIN